MAAPVATPRLGPAWRVVLHVIGGILGIALVIGGAKELLEQAARDEFDVRASYVRVQKIVIENESGTVRLNGVPAGKPVRVHAHVTRSLTEPRRRSSRAPNGTLQLGASCASLFSDNCQVDYTLDVPADVRLEVNTSAGAIHASGIRSRAPVRLHSRAGAVLVATASAPALELRTNAGPIRASGIRAERITATTAAGPVELAVDEAAQSIQARSSAGPVFLQVPDVAYALDVSTTAGRVFADAVRRDPNSPYRISAETAAGSVRIDVRR